MAPLITITIHALLGSVGFKQHQSPVSASKPDPISVPSPKPCQQQPLKILGPRNGAISLSASSWGTNRMDVYGILGNGNVSHKWWDGYQWGPSADKLEDLGFPAAAAPAGVSWGQNRLDIFSPDFDGQLGHKYWDGSGWRPDGKPSESLGGSVDFHGSSLSVTSWGTGRLDVFGVGATDGELLHKYWDGSQWNPQDGLENLGLSLSSGVSAVSWGEGRLDVFALDQQNTLLHVYYDGTKWNTEAVQKSISLSQPTVISWGVNRLDVFATSLEDGSLWHLAWDGYQWLPWDNLGGSDLIGPVGAVSWGPNRLDVVALGADTGYYYKYWDGSQWNPTDSTLISKGGSFFGVPALVSWGENRLDIFGVTTDSQLGHQTWYGSGWYPEWSFETLGGSLISTSLDESKTHQEL